jgi:hypothetical protein
VRSLVSLVLGQPFLQSGKVWGTNSVNRKHIVKDPAK